MKLGPLFKWFGSKWQSAKHYPRPEHETIVEPFAGGAGFSLNYSDKNVVLWEDDPNISELWKWLINQAAALPDLVLEIPINLPIGTDILDVGLSRGQELLLKHWQRTNNAGDCWKVSPWGHLPGQWTANTRARVADQVGGVAHWEVRQPIELIDTPCHWFIDPPYLFNYRYRASLPEFDYDNLCSFVQTIHRDSMVVVCEAIRKSDGAIPNYLPFSHSHRSVTSRRKQTQSHHSSEVIYIRPPFTSLSLNASRGAVDFSGRTEPLKFVEAER